MFGTDGSLQSLEFDKIQTLGLAGPVAISESQSRILNMGVSGHGHILNADAPPSKDEVKENGPDRDLFEWGRQCLLFRRSFSWLQSKLKPSIECHSTG